ncbi:MAG: nucleotidyltransferase domain-containing protein [Deltaproteobacteria bacterium]|nr:nucleotidyltransferase domain-containing protein [Deltaproteobacteria bacterium]
MAPRLSPQETATLDTFASALRARFGARMSGVTLFGSRARGEGRGDSDLDLLVLVDGVTRKERGEVLDLACDLGVASGLVLSPLVAATEAWRPELPLARAVASEGVSW